MDAPTLCTGHDGRPLPVLRKAADLLVHQLQVWPLVQVSACDDEQLALELAGAPAVF